MLSKISLRWRLLGAGLLCALQTGLSGTGGIFSLRTVNDRMQDTTTNVVQTMADQDFQVKQLIGLRSLVAEVSSASDLSGLSVHAAALDSMGRNWDSQTNRSGESVVKAASELARHKRDLLSSQAELDSLRRSTSAALLKITGLALQIVDNSQFEMVMGMDHFTANANRNLQRLETGQTGSSSGGGIDHLAELVATDIAEMEKQSTGALDKAGLAWALKNNCHRLVALVHESLLGTDPYLVMYQGKKCQSLLGTVTEELSRLPEDSNTRAIDYLIPGVQKLLMDTNDAKRHSLFAQIHLSRSLAKVNDSINELDSAMVRNSYATRVGAEATMKSVSTLASRWQKIELLLVGSSFLLAVGIGMALARSVTLQLQGLNDGIKKVAEGNLDFNLDTGTSDEIGQLSRAFDDMTEQLSVRGKVIQESEKRFRGLFEESNDGVLILRPDGRISDANLRISEIVGYPREQLLGMNVRDLHLPEDLNTSPITIRDLTEYRSGHSETRYRKADDTVIHVGISASVIDAEKGLAQALIRDISDRKQADLEQQNHIAEISAGKARLEKLMSNTAEREIRMIQLKQEVNDLLASVGEAGRYEAPAKVRELTGDEDQDAPETQGATPCH